MMSRLRRMATRSAIAILSLTTLCLLNAPQAYATTTQTADTNGGYVWCIGYTPYPESAATINGYVYPAVSGYTTYPNVAPYPADTAPDGLLTNPNPAPDAWEDNLILWPVNPSRSGPGETMETTVTGAGTLADDRYVIQLDYWNSIALGLPIEQWNATAATPGVAGTSHPGSLGYSDGNSCILAYPSGTYDGSFTITYPASPSLPVSSTNIPGGATLTSQYGLTTVATQTASANVPSEDTWAAYYSGFPFFGKPPYFWSSAAGGPTGYISTYKGCSWDANSCTQGSAVVPASASATAPPPPNSDWNAFPEVLSNITSIPTSWQIGEDTTYGTPFIDAGHGTTDPDASVWDASYDIWFDTTGKTGVGIGPGPYGTARGQNDGLEIMVWMDSNGSYVDAPNSAPSTTGYAQPSGAIREQVVINNVLYDVWTSRLNNPYYGAYSSTSTGGTATATFSNYNVVQGGYEPYTCNTLKEYWNTTTGASGTNPSDTTCGTEWNVVSFVATNGNRKTAMNMDTKVFTDYILGIPDGLWAYPNTNTQATDPDSRLNSVLQCPGSATDVQGNLLSADLIPNAVQGTNTVACLNPNWLLTSVQAGFEPWQNGNGLTSQKFVAHVVSYAAPVQSGLTSGNGLPIVTWDSPFDVVYPGCPAIAGSGTTPAQGPYTQQSTTPPLLYISGWNGVYYSFTVPANYNYPDMPGGITIPGGAAMTYPYGITAANEQTLAIPMTWNSSTKMWQLKIPSTYPLNSDVGGAYATINIIDNTCGTEPITSIPIYIDPSGQVFYNDGKTPAQGATVTLLNAPSGSSSGPFVPVPNNNYGLSSDVMEPQDNTQNSMASTQYGAYAWDVAPGYYEVSASLAGCGTVTSPVQHVVSVPITNLFLDLPCAPPKPVALATASIPSAPATLSATAGSSSQIDLNWSQILPPLNAASWTYTVYEISPVSQVIASGLTGTDYQVTGLNPATTYTFAVKAVDNGGSSDYSPEVTTNTQPPPAGHCHVSYVVQSAQPGVNNGLTVNLNITNTGTTAIYPWTLAWTFPGNQKISYAWNTVENQGGENVTLSSTANWESIPAGGTLYSAVGFNGSYTGTNATPAAFYLNGQLCQ